MAAHTWRDHQLEHGRVIRSAPDGITDFIPGKYYWPVDWTVVDDGSAHRGLPPTGHHRRCQSYAKHKRPHILQCGRWSLVGERTCAKHNPRRGKATPVNIKRRVNSYYRRKAGPKLRELIDAAQDGTPEQQLSLLEELAIARALSVDTLRKWDAAQEQGSEETKLLANEALRAVINHVVAVAEKAAKVRTQVASVVQVEHIDYVLHHVGLIVEAEVDPQTAKRVSDRIAKIELPTAANAAQNPTALARQLREQMQAMDGLTDAESTDDADEDEDAA